MGNRGVGIAPAADQIVFDEVTGTLGFNGVAFDKKSKTFSAPTEIRIVLEGLRGEESIASLCRREGLNPNLYYRWSKEFLEAGKKRLVGDTTREATSNEVTGLRKEVTQLKQVVAELVLENRLLKKDVTAFDSEGVT